MTLLRHLLSILLLPCMAVLAVPTLLLTGFANIDTRWGFGPLESAARGVGVMAGLAGLALFAWCVVLFARVGRGTLAPWDPTQQLVAAGPYRFVRNPMITGVAAMLFGRALFTGSTVLALWAALFVLVNHLYFILSEEPGLEKRFGAGYRSYKAQVPRWLPRWPGS